MPVSISTLKSEILVFLNSTAGLELEQAKDQFAQKLATAVYNAIVSATVTIPSGGIVTTGSAVTQTNPAPVIGTLS